MKNIIFFGIVAAVVVGGGIFIMHQSSPTGAIMKNASEVPSGAVVMKMRDDAYDPTDITIKKGQTVTFVNESKDWRWPASNLHPTHDIYPEFDPKEPVATGKSWSFQFNKVGKWGWHDHLAPYITGTITVTQ